MKEERMTYEEVKKAIEQLKNSKSDGTRKIFLPMRPEELIQRELEKIRKESKQS